MYKSAVWLNGYVSTLVKVGGFSLDKIKSLLNIRRGEGFIKSLRSPFGGMKQVPTNLNPEEVGNALFTRNYKQLTQDPELLKRLEKYPFSNEASLRKKYPRAMATERLGVGASPKDPTLFEQGVDIPSNAPDFTAQLRKRDPEAYIRKVREYRESIV